MMPKLEQAFGALEERGAAARPALPAAPAGDTPARSTWSTSRARAQSQIRIGWIGVARSTPDYYALDVLNTMLGGSFTSRLNMNLREEHGYTYGAGSRFDMRRSPARSSRPPACRPTRRSSR